MRERPTYTCVKSARVFVTITAIESQKFRYYDEEASRRGNSVDLFNP